MKILAIDPGESSGICKFSDPKNYQTTTVKKDILKLVAVIEDYKPDVLVFEKFALYPSKAQSLAWDEMYTSQVIGVIKYICIINNIPYHEQTPANKEYVVYPKNYQFDNDHEKDAFGHAWFFYMNNK